MSHPDKPQNRFIYPALDLNIRSISTTYRSHNEICGHLNFSISWQSRTLGRPEADFDQSHTFNMAYYQRRQNSLTLQASRAIYL